PQILVNVKVREKIAFETITAIAEEKRAIDTTLEGRGRLLLRYSGTENLARVMIEGPDQSEIEILANTLAVRISESLS
ncbi:MAG: phosphoglucosamine mutase, partial [Acidobacteriota bacterium]